METYKIELVLFDGKERENYAPINKIGKYYCPSSHLVKTIHTGKRKNEQLA